MINNKIEEINKLLNDESLLDKYIKTIDDSNVSIPVGLENRTLNGLKRKNQIKKSSIFLDILKIAACTTIAICIWNSGISNKIYSMNNIRKSDTYMKVGKVMNDINNFFMSSINFERRDK